MNIQPCDNEFESPIRHSPINTRIIKSNTKNNCINKTGQLAARRLKACNRFEPVLAKRVHPLRRHQRKHMYKTYLDLSCFHPQPRGRNAHLAGVETRRTLSALHRLFAAPASVNSNRTIIESEHTRFEQHDGRAPRRQHRHRLPFRIR